MALNPSSKFRAKKRPRLSNEFSNEPSSSPVETNSPPCWDREVAAVAQTASKVRDLDWRCGEKNLNTALSTVFELRLVNA
ncbi:unnamed protein product [Penicillium viridicatum]